MDDKLTLEIVVPERRLLKEEVDEVTAPGVLGYFGILPGHTPFLSGLEAGEVSYRIGDQRRYLVISGGYAEAGPEKVTILAETAELAEEIDAQRARQAAERAEERLGRRDNTEEIDHQRAQAALSRARARLQVAERAR
jgi:F-type H+-transporting ATPase subunit epsilon